MSGKKFGQWVYENWPMDIWATLALLLILMVVAVVVYAKLRPESYTSKRDACFSGLYMFFRAVGFTIISPWLALRALGFSKNGGDHYNFDPIKFFFNLACFTGILLLFGSGRTMEGICIGPNVEDKSAVVRVVKTVAKKAKKGRRSSRRRAAPSGGKRYRCWVQVGKLTTDPISFYALMMILLFMGMFYYRHDLKEGDRANGLAQIIDSVGRLLTIKYGGAAALPQADSVVSSETVVATGDGEKKEGGPPPVQDDPFVR